MLKSLPIAPHGASKSHSLSEALTKQGIDLDPHQRLLVDVLEQFTAPTSDEGPRGVYIYGPPGRGKTMITNEFVALQPAESTRRFHFHEFFHKLNSPVHRVAGQAMGSVFSQGLVRELAGVNLLIFDEFHCTEPGDAMLMSKLVQYCAEQNISLITTSNYQPENLLDDDAFHHLVKPTINLIRENFEVIELDNTQDYRFLAASERSEYSGFRAGTLTLHPQTLTQSNQPTVIEIGYDQIKATAIDQETVWISFDQLCRTRRNTADYLDLATRFSRWHISQIPASATMPMDEERRLANLIDVFYDKDVEVHLYAEDDLSELGHMLHGTEKARLTSRLAQLKRLEHERTSA